jgi:hypothetical protein
MKQKIDVVNHTFLRQGSNISDPRATEAAKKKGNNYDENLQTQHDADDGCGRFYRPNGKRDPRFCGSRK